ncbi:MAG TPA: nicotinate-nucleotide adenylyltransferase [Candidatus Limnocylindria bacterium]
MSLTPVATRRRTRLVPVGRPAPSGRPRPARDAPPPNRIGILGGTFDPPHIGHLWLATMAADEMHLSKVLLVPAANPPHKRRRAISHAADRVLMARLAVANDPRLDVSLVELEREGPSYTVDTLLELRHRHPDDELVLIMAADSLAQVESWREPARLLELALWAVGPRPGTALPSRAELAQRFGRSAGRIHLLSGPALDVSASQVRRRVAAGRAIRYLVPRAVEELILERGLYRR